MFTKVGAILELLWRRRVTRFLAVAGLCSALQLVILSVLTRYFGVDKLTANGLGFGISAQVNFILSSILTWGDRPVHGSQRSRRGHRIRMSFRAQATRWALFMAVAMVALVVNELVFDQTARYGARLLVASFAGILVGALVSFTLNNLGTFRDNKSVEGEQLPDLDDIRSRVLRDGVAFFLPTYNEEANLPILVAAVVDYFRRLQCEFKIIIVDDGSSDGTAAIAASLADKYFDHVIVETHNPNRGYGGALLTGIRSALKTRYGLVAFCDADRQFGIESFGTLLKALIDEQADMAIGYRIKRADSLKRLIMGRAWHWLSSHVVGYKAHDVDCGFKLFTRAMLEQLEPRLAGAYAAMSPEILARATAAGFKFVETGVTHLPRTEGHNTGSDLKVVIASLVNLFALRLQLQLEHLDGPSDRLLARATAAGFKFTDSVVTHEAKLSLQLLFRLLDLSQALKGEIRGRNEYAASATAGA